MNPINHKVRINVANQDGDKQTVIESVVETIPKKLFKKLFSGKRKVLIITPADSVKEVEIHEIASSGG